MTKKLTTKEVRERMEKLPNWNVLNDNLFLIREYKFKNWIRTMQFINEISEIAENINHHPNINFTYGLCEVKTQTHTVNSVTALDFELAEKINLISIKD
jgi:4a-hydroxytetrahydrobiopterin dehydratase